MTRPHASEREELHRILEDLRAKGWTVFTEHQLDSEIPPNLVMRPDFLAVRGGKRLVGEVINRHRPPSKVKLRQLEELASQLPADWEFKVYYTDDTPPVEQEQDIRTTAREAREILSVSPLGAVLYGWVALEKALGRLESRYSIRRSWQKVPSLTQLNSIGAISDHAFEALSRLQKARNLVAHGRADYPSVDRARSDALNLIEWAELLASDRYASPGEMVEWFKSRYENFVADGSDSSDVDSRISGKQDILSVLRDHFEGALPSDLDDVAAILASETNDWVLKERQW